MVKKKRERGEVLRVGAKYEDGGLSRAQAPAFCDFTRECRARGGRRKIKRRRMCAPRQAEVVAHSRCFAVALAVILEYNMGV